MLVLVLMMSAPNITDAKLCVVSQQNCALHDANTQRALSVIMVMKPEEATWASADVLTMFDSRDSSDTNHHCPDKAANMSDLFYY